MTLILYEDREMKKPFDIVNFVLVEVGMSKSKEIYLGNSDSKHQIIDIKETISDKDVTIANMPNTLNSRESKPVVITFKPSLDRDEGLHSDIFFVGKLVMI